MANADKLVNTCTAEQQQHSLGRPFIYCAFCLGRSPFLSSYSAKVKELL